MVYDVLNKLFLEGRLKKCSITVSHKGAVRNIDRIYGRDITGVTRSCIQYLGGETGYEKLSAPLESVLEIEISGKVVFNRKKRIKNIYPRH